MVTERMKEVATPRVSIVTPAFNCEDYIAATIRSVLSQTVSDFELLIVDDGSTDRTAAAAQCFAVGDPRVRVIRQQNSGQSAARNAAIRQARGSHFALLDADDVWTPTFLAEQLAIFDAHPDVDIVSANAHNLGGPWDGAPLKPVVGDCRVVSLLDLICVEDSICIASMFSRRVVETIGGFDEELRSNEDYDFWLRAAWAGCKLVFNPKPLAYYRRRANSVSTQEIETLSGILQVLRKVRRLCEDRPIELRYLDRQIARFEQESLLAKAKNDLHARDYHASALHFSELYRTTGSRQFRMLAVLVRYAPGVLRWAHSVKTSYGQSSRVNS
jgi:glycosyltransferase involved in cell wall biosynthesis